MRILINDFKENQDKYATIFGKFGYEKNELIFCSSFTETKEFIGQYLDIKKLHIDIIITNDSSKLENDSLNCSELSFLKNSITESFSNRNFRICSIPIILYSNNETKSYLKDNRYDAIIKKNSSDQHDYFVKKCELIIQNWRKCLFSDLEALELKLSDLSDFIKSNKFKNYYFQKISRNADNYFANRTKVVSTEFIRCPQALNYDWIILQDYHIEQGIIEYINTYKNHIKYDRRNNERTILHRFFNQNKLILLRDVYSDMDYEKNLNEINAKNSEECDFILKTEYPEFLKTTFFEVKKEDITFYVKKNTKRPQISSPFLSNLEQIWGYKKYVQNPVNMVELENKLEYRTQNFDFVLLAGRLEEKEEMYDKFNEDIDRMYSGVKVITYEELEEINLNYLDKFNRLRI